MGLFDFFKKRKPAAEKPAEAAPAAQQASAQSAAAAAKPFSHDKADWQWDSAYDAFWDRNPDFDGELTPEQEDMVWSCAGLHMEFFLTWAIQHDFAGRLHLEEDAQALQDVKEEKMTGHAFFVQYCDCVLSRADMCEEILGFVDAYYEAHYMDEFSQCMAALGQEILETPFSWELYHQFAPTLDKAYENYKQGLYA